MNKADTGKNKLEISLNSKKVLSKNQQLFNSLTKRIEKLESEIEQKKAHYNNVLEYYSKKIEPLEIDSANLIIKLAESLDKACDKFKFSKKQKENIQTAINELFEQAFMHLEPTLEQKDVYDKWAYLSYEEDKEFNEKIEKEMLRNFMKNATGIDMDMSEFDGSPESFANYQEKIRIHLEEEQRKSENKKKSKKQIQKEEALKAQEALKSKNIRSIYIALAKILHPDSEVNEDLKAEKENLMKKVTVAYEQNDLPTLLKMEMEWIHQTSEHLEQIADEKLKIYISILKEQAMELEKEKFSEKFNPRYN